MHNIKSDDTILPIINTEHFAIKKNLGTPGISSDNKDYSI